MTRFILFLALFSIVGLGWAGCDDDGGDIGTSDSDTDTDSDSDTDTDFDEWLEVPTCMEACETPADCVSDTPSLYGQDNFVCEDGHCVYVGCHIDGECEEVYGEGYGCCDNPGNSNIPACVRLCEDEGDCAVEYGLGAYDYDNYECMDIGYCRYLGCHDSDECYETHGTEDYQCLDAQFLPIKTCQRTCSEAADCATGGGDAYDADNFLCEEGRCIYTGCGSTHECEETTGMGDGWECVEP